MKLNEATIYIVGTGGTGSHLADLLARYMSFNLANSPRRIVLVDDDRIEEHNAERQRFDRLEAGKYKVEVIARKLRETSGFGRIEALPLRFTPETMPHDIGRMSEQKASIIVFVCIDSARGRNAIWSELIGRYDADKRNYESNVLKYEGNFLIIDGGNDFLSGQVTSCLRVKYGDFDAILGQDPRVLFENVRNADPRIMSCAAAPEDRVAQSVMANIMVSNLMFNEFLSIVNHHTFYPLVKFDLTERRAMPIGTMCDLKAEYQKYRDALKASEETVA